MKVVFFGTPTFAVPTLKRLLAEPEIEVLGIVTQPDKRRGRGNQLVPSPVKEIALANGLSVWQPQRIKKDKDTLDLLQRSGADVFVVVAYGQILSQAILDMPRSGCINVHGSLLPEYRGAAPIQWCLFHGETETGITTMLMDAGMDTGAVLLKAGTSIGLLDNAHQLAQTLADLGADLLVETLDKLEAIAPTPQDAERATYAPLIKKQDYAIDWTESAIAIHNRVRAFFPDCMAELRGNGLKIVATAPLGPAYWPQLPQNLAAIESQWTALNSRSGRPGEVMGFARGIGPIVQTGDGLLLLLEVQPAGKRSQSGVDFVNGARLSLEERFANGPES